MSSFGDLSESDIPQALANIEEYKDNDQPPRNIRPVDVCQVAVDSTAPLHHAVRQYVHTVVLYLLLDKLIAYTSMIVESTN